MTILRQIWNILFTNSELSKCKFGTYNRQIWKSNISNATDLEHLLRQIWNIKDERLYNLLATDLELI